MYAIANYSENGCSLLNNDYYIQIEVGIPFNKNKEVVVGS
jgi:hypothetical protein